MNKHIAAVLCCAIIFSIIPGVVGAQATEKTPRKYDKLLTAVESFARLNAQIEIREREFKILAPFVNEVIIYADQLKGVCDPKCLKSVNNYRPKLYKSLEALSESNRRYRALVPNITERNAFLMAEIKGVGYRSTEQEKEKAIISLNRLDLESLYHYRAYASTYKSADKAMLSLATTSDFVMIVTSLASTTDRLVKEGKVEASMSTKIGDIKNRIPGIRARIKALEDRRQSLVCTATLAKDYSVGVKCVPSF
ncbi:hypothetical protein K8Q93_01865 [Candidatus Parcubacteria bacterium]|nr:hypothetical protein [Candidatus Parcubacteria bacterium]